MVFLHQGGDSRVCAARIEGRYDSPADATIRRRQNATSTLPRAERRSYFFSGQIRFGGQIGWILSLPQISLDLHL